MKRINFKKQISPNKTIELHQKKKITNNNFLSNNSKQNNSKKNSKKSSTNQTFYFNTKKNNNTKNSTSKNASNPSNNSKTQKSNIKPLISSKPFTKKYNNINNKIPNTILKKSSNFTKFHNKQTTKTFNKQQNITSILPNILPIKPFKKTPQLPSLNKLKHSSTPSKHNTPRNKPSTIPQTPS